MAYTDQASLAGSIPPEFLLEALDDDRDGEADAGVWAAVEAAAAGEVDSRLGARYAVPLAAPLPPVVAEAARVFVLELLHQRRGVAPEANPWRPQADAMRRRLEAIGDGAKPLSPGAGKASAPVGIVTSAARTVPASGQINC